MAILPQYLSIFPKDNANRGQNKMNEFIFYAGVQLIFAFLAKIIIYIIFFYNLRAECV